MHSILGTRVSYFLRTAQTQSFSEAASKLGISQAALSLSIKNLEDELGVSLFDRGRHGCSLTPQGLVLFKKLSKYEQAIEADVREAIGLTRRQVMKIGCVPHFAANHLLSAMDKIGGEATAPIIQLFSVLSFHGYQAVESGELDFAFVSWDSRPKSLKYIEVQEDPMAVVGLKRRFAHIAKAKTANDLENEPWIYFPKPQWAWSDLVPAGRPGHVARDFYICKSLILSGRGICDIEVGFFSEKEKKELVFAGVPSSYPSSKIYVVYRADIGKPVLEFIDSLLRFLR